MKFYVVIIFIFFNIFFGESKLLRSKYLTEEMIGDVGELDKYEKKARVIFSKYEKAKFYQIVAYTYYEKYIDLVQELESLDRHYYYVFSNYDAENSLELIDSEVNSPGIQNDFTPILFEENSKINIKLFKAKVGLFKKQYYSYLNYFNKKIKMYNNELSQIKKKADDKIRLYDSNKIFSDYKSFLLNQENIDKNFDNELIVVYSEDIILEISWPNKNYKRIFIYRDNSNQISKTIDSKDGKLLLETNYDIIFNDDVFLTFLKSNNISLDDYEDYGIYSIQKYNDFEKVEKITYYSINNKVIGVIVREFEEDFLKLISENWYIGEYSRKIREFNNIFEPKSSKYIWVEKEYR